MQSGNKNITSIPEKGKSLSLQDLNRIRLNIPPGTCPPGVKIVVIFTQSGPEIGYINTGDAPDVYPMADLIRLGSINRLVGSSDSVTNRSRQGDIVKIVSKKVSGVDAPNFGPAGPKAVADAIALTSALEGNLESVQRNTAIKDKSRSYKKLLIESFEKTSEVLHGYIDHQVRSGGIKKTFKEFCAEHGLPYWLFTHATTKGWVPDTPQDPLTTLLFPKNVSKGLALRVYEWEDDTIIDFLKITMENSTLLRSCIHAIDEITDTKEEDRSSRDNELLTNLLIPVMPPWTVHENATMKRSANPVAIRDGVLAPFHAVVGRLFLASVGNGPRNITQKTFWKSLVDYDIDPYASQSAMAQYADENVANKEAFDELIKTGAGNDTLKLVALDLSKGDARLDAILDGIDKVTVGAQPVVKVSDSMPDPTSCADLFNKINVKVKEDRALQTIALDLTKEEAEILENPAWSLPTIRKKERTYPLGDAPTAKATMLLNVLRPGKNKEEDRHFAGLYHALTELLSSFNNPKVTDRAVAMIRASMVRLKKEGLFFSSDALTGQGGELISATDQQLFSDL